MDLPTHINAEPIPGYRLIERLGRGGYGEVWKAEAPGGMHKAIKFVFGDLDGAGADAQAAEQEFKSLNRVKTIRHPFILSLERIEVVDGQLIIVMELADRNLADRFNECVQSGLRGIPRAELLRYMEEAAEALDLMNVQYQIQHLDIKPQNVFLIHRHVKVADFGLAKDLEGARAKLTGGITPMYAPPETFDGWVSRQSDQYSLSIVYMEMLTGRRPFDGNSARQLILQHMTAQPDLSALPSPDREAVARALSKRPEDRFPTCEDFLRALQAPGPTGSEAGRTFADRPESTPGLAATPLVNCPTERAIRTNHKSLPNLVTPKSRSQSGASTTVQRRAAPSVISTPRTVPVERTGPGVLVPALLVGVGGVGLEVLRAIRGLVVEKYGRASLPHLRWLYLDTDLETAAAATADPGPGRLSADEVCLTRLNRPSYYLSRDSLPPVDTWLGMDSLFRIPRKPITDGIRGLGRLALCDHYHIVCHRLRTALEAFLEPRLLEEASRITGLGMRSTFPRVYLAAALTGGTGSGMCLDLAYLIRREVRRMGFGDPHVVGVLGIPGDDPHSYQKRGLANAWAGLVELQFFGRPDHAYEAVLDTREGVVSDPDRPFQRVSFFRLTGHSDGPQTESPFADAAQTVFRDLLTPLGRTAYPDTGPRLANPWTAVGTLRVEWPRGHMIKWAGWLLARRTLAGWSGKLGPESATAVDGAMESAWPGSRLHRSKLRKELDSRLTTRLEQPAEVRVATILRGLSDHADPRGIEVGSARRAMRDFVQLLGRPQAEDSESSCVVGDALTTVIHDFVSEFNRQLTVGLHGVVEQPALRVAGAEEILRRVRSWLTTELTETDRMAAPLEEGSNSLFLHLQEQLNSPGTEQVGRRTLDQLREWADLRRRLLLLRGCASVYRTMLGNVPEHQRELGILRAHLEALARQLEDVAPSAPQSSDRCRWVFPDGARSVIESATQLANSFSEADRRALDQSVQARISRELHGLASACARPQESARPLLVILTEEAIRHADARCPRTIPVALLTDPAADDQEALHDEVAGFLAAARPSVAPHIPPTLTVLAIPEEAEPIARAARELCPGHTIHVTPTSGDLAIWRECRGLTLESFAYLKTNVGEEGTSQNGLPEPPAHARSDVNWPQAVDPVHDPGQR